MPPFWRTSPIGFCLSVDFLGLRRNGTSLQIINQAQEILEQASRHGNLDQL